jgi:hypothetical protein
LSVLQRFFVFLTTVALVSWIAGCPTDDDVIDDDDDNIGDDDYWGDDDDDEWDPGAGKTYLVLGSVAAGGGDLSAADAHGAFLGEWAGDWSGRTVLSAGDMDGDGVADLVIDAPQNSEGDQWNGECGKTYLFWGSSAGDGGTRGLEEADAWILGDPGPGNNHSLVAPGDLDGDGFADLAISGPEQELTGARVFVFSGEELAVGGGYGLDDAHVVLTEDGEEEAGRSLAGAGDVDGDGLAELLVGARFEDPDWNDPDEPGPDMGRFYLLTGDQLAPGGTISLASAAISFVGEDGDATLGVGAAAGDVDGDGLGDVVVSASNYDDGSDKNVGRVYLFFGSSLVAGGEFGAEQADARIEGEQPNDWLGRGLTTMGDLDGDGGDDLLLGSGGHGGTGEMAIFLSGSLVPGAELSLGQADRLSSGGELNNHGRVVSALDVDGDGLADVLGSDPSADQPGGVTYLFSGADLLAADTFGADDALASFTGEQDGDQAGASIALVDDLDGDGLAEILIGAPDNREVTEEPPDGGSVDEPCAGTDGAGDPVHAPAIVDFEYYHFTTEGGDSSMVAELEVEDPDDDVDGVGQIHVFTDGDPYTDLVAEEDTMVPGRFSIHLPLGDDGLPYGTQIHFGFTVTDAAGNVSGCEDDVIWTLDP